VARRAHDWAVDQLADLFRTAASLALRLGFALKAKIVLFFLLERIHSSTDQQCSHADSEHMTPETLYEHQASSSKSSARHRSDAVNTHVISYD